MKSLISTTQIKDLKTIKTGSMSIILKRMLEKYKEIILSAFKDSVKFFSIIGFVFGLTILMGILFVLFCKIINFLFPI